MTWPKVFNQYESEFETNPVAEALDLMDGFYYACMFLSASSLCFTAVCSLGSWKIAHAIQPKSIRVFLHSKIYYAIA